MDGTLNLLSLPSGVLNRVDPFFFPFVSFAELGPACFGLSRVRDTVFAYSACVRMSECACAPFVPSSFQVGIDCRLPGAEVGERRGEEPDEPGV